MPTLIAGVSTGSSAALIIKNNFIQPTVNALGYTLADFAIHWSAGPWQAAG